MATTDLTKFLKTHRKNQQLALDAATRAINGTLNEMYERMVDRTPVGDPSLWNWPAHGDYTPGTLKASWSLSFNGVQRQTNGRFASASQISESGGLSLRLGQDRGAIATISNPQPYAERVETGWSTQAPQGMMRITTAEYASILNDQAAINRIK